VADEDDEPVPNQIPRGTDEKTCIERREKLRKITVFGLQYMESKKVGFTILGHEIKVQDGVAKAVSLVEWADKFITTAVKDLPYPTLA
jgi:hypothetical protein